MSLTIYTDGGARGNPGPAGYGLVISDDHQQVVYQASKFLGVKTNNEAEYLALIAALTWISQNHPPASNLIFCSDSQLVVRQVQGIYKIKAPHLQPLHQTVLRLLAEINLPYQFRSVPREQNSLADQLANQAMDRGSP